VREASTAHNTPVCELERQLAMCDLRSVHSNTNGAAIKGQIRRETGTGKTACVKAARAGPDAHGTRWLNARSAVLLAALANLAK
jgi:hypothetical protein